MDARRARGAGRCRPGGGLRRAAQRTGPRGPRPAGHPLVHDHRADRPSGRPPGPDGPVRATAPAPAGRGQAPPGERPAPGRHPAGAGRRHRHPARTGRPPPRGPGHPRRGRVAGEGAGRDGGGRRASIRRTAAFGPSAAEQPVAGPPRAVAGRARRAGFWREQAAAFTAAPGTPTGYPDPDLPVATLRGVRLGEGATLLLEPGRQVDAADVQAVLDAARPLLAVLRERGLGPRPGHRPGGEHEPRREHP